MLRLQVETSRACSLVDHIRHACVRPTHHLPAVAALPGSIAACFVSSTRKGVVLRTRRLWQQQRVQCRPERAGRGSFGALRAREAETDRPACRPGTREAIGRNRTTRRTTTPAHASPRSLQARRRSAGGGVGLCVGLWRNSSGGRSSPSKATDRPRSPPARRESER